MCQSWPLAWWKMRVWELKEIPVPCPSFTPLYLQRFSLTLVLTQSFMGLGTRSGHKASLKRQREREGGMKGRRLHVTTCQCHHGNAVAPKRPSAMVGRGAAISQRGTSATQEKAGSLVQPCTNSDSWLCLATKGLALLLWERMLLLISLEDSLLTDKENGKSCVCSLSCTVHWETGVRRF